MAAVIAMYKPYTAGLLPAETTSHIAACTLYNYNYYMDTHTHTYTFRHT